MYELGVVYRNITRADRAAADGLAALGSATVHEAMGRVGLLKPYMRPIYSGQQVSGTAVTVLLQPGDNWMMHVAAEQIREGDLVIASFMYCDNTCPHCRHGITSACINGGIYPTNGDGAQGEAGNRPPVHPQVAGRAVEGRVGQHRRNEKRQRQLRIEDHRRHAGNQREASSGERHERRVRRAEPPGGRGERRAAQEQRDDDLEDLHPCMLLKDYAHRTTHPARDARRPAGHRSARRAARRHAP